MINFVLDMFESPSSPLLELVSQKYDYLIVDEYQDTNLAQYQLVNMLYTNMKNENLCMAQLF